MKQKIRKILVANRGEIALRVMRTARKLGIKTVAVYSEADRLSPHVLFADEAYCIGEAPSSKSYLLGDRIIEVCKKAGADAIHPGYGFLSENAKFADMVRTAGIIFIGPSSEAIQMMGDKLAAKDAARKYNIPMVPGTESAVTDIEQGKQTAREVGYPILIKASAGGGGKGMRVVLTEDDFEEQMKTAVSEASSAFGNGAVFIERYVSSPRHIEIQIMADSHGNVVYLFERECSVQRRHQKVVEEAPSSVLTEEIRKKMGECAVNVARACNYENAGTVEFLLDENLDFYFLEMNTRLQVEHPVTEFITGKDLVEEQINIAEGGVLSFSQEELKILGHSIELRVCAEDPENNFLPDIGKLETYKIPQGKNIRVDDGFKEGMEVPIFYDPMLAKLIVYGKTRPEAIQKMIEAIDAYRVAGVKTTLPFGRFVMQHESFTSGNYNTHFVKDYFTVEALSDNETQEIAAIIAAKAFELYTEENIKSDTTKSNWKIRR